MKNFKIVNTMLLIITIIVIQSDFTKADSDYLQFLNSDIANLPKCCAANMGLTKTSTSMSCSSEEIKLTHYEIVSTNYLISSNNIGLNNETFSNICANLTCVDFLYFKQRWSLVKIDSCKVTKTINNFTFFPKCCPNNYVYDPLNHTCVKSKINTNIYLFGGNTQVINVSLSHCPNNYALVDFPSAFTVNASDKSVIVGNTTLEYQSYCIDRNANNDLDLIRACLPYDDVCGVMKKRCLKKCCPDGEIYMKRNQRASCYPYYTYPFDVTNNTRFTASDNDFGIIFSSPGKKYIAKAEHQFHIDEFGNFTVLQNKEWSTMNPADAFYCREGWLNPRNEVESLLFLLISADPVSWYRNIKYYIQGIILGVSTVFMFLTAVCYLFVPVLRNLHGRCMFMYCTFMTMSSATLCCVQLQIINLDYFYCTHTGFVIFYVFVGAFAWMNVVCFDMWIAFGSVNASRLHNDKKTFKKFIYYSLYGFGVPTTLVGFAYIVYKTECFPYPFVPHIGVRSCYFDKRDDTYDYIIYFLIPVTLMQLANVVLFIKTTKYCYKVKKEIQRMQAPKRNNTAKKKKLFDDKETLKMLFKIFLIMGIPWTFECFSSTISLKETLTLLIIEAIGDYINSAQGLIIFCVLILKKRTFKSLRSMFWIRSGKYSVNSPSTSRTKSTELTKQNTFTSE